MTPLAELIDKVRTICCPEASPDLLETYAVYLHHWLRFSFKCDEGRFPRLLFHIPSHLGQVEDGPSFVRLGNRKRGGKLLGELASFAPAIAPPFAIVVDVSTCQYVGVALPGPDTMRAGVHVGLRAPGEMEVTLVGQEKEQSWLVLPNHFGEASRIWSLHEAKSVCSSRAGTRLCDSALRESSGTENPRVVREHAERVIDGIVSRVVKGGHGGALVFCEHETLSTLLSKAEKEPVIHLSNSPMRLLADPSRDSQLCLMQVEAVANLTQVDGAVLLDRGWTVHAAGAMLNSGTACVVRRRGEQATPTDPVDLDEKGFGTRHRSAASFCQQNEGAVALVISQDGLIHLFEHDGGSDTDGPFAALEGPFVDRMLSA